MDDGYLTLTGILYAECFKNCPRNRERTANGPGDGTAVVLLPDVDKLTANQVTRQSQFRDHIQFMLYIYILTLGLSCDYRDFSWMLPLIKKIYRKQFNSDDMCEVRPQDSSEFVMDQLER